MTDEEFAVEHGLDFDRHVAEGIVRLLDVATENDIGPAVFLSSLTAAFAHNGWIAAEPLMSAEQYGTLLRKLVVSAGSCERPASQVIQ